MKEKEARKTSMCQHLTGVLVKMSALGRHFHVSKVTLLRVGGKWCFISQRFNAASSFFPFMFMLTQTHQQLISLENTEEGKPEMSANL